MWLRNETSYMWCAKIGTEALGVILQPDGRQPPNYIEIGLVFTSPSLFALIFSSPECTCHSGAIGHFSTIAPLEFRLGAARG